MPRNIPRTDTRPGPQLRRQAYALVADYLAAVPADPTGVDGDARLWRAVDLALDVVGLAPMTYAGVLGEAQADAVTAVRLLRHPVSAVDLDQAEPAPVYYPAGWRTHEAPHWRNLVEEHGAADAREVIYGCVSAGGAITGLPDSWEDHEEWMRSRGNAANIGNRKAVEITPAERILIAETGIPAYAVAAILGRYPDAIERIREAMRSSRGCA